MPSALKSANGTAAANHHRDKVAASTAVIAVAARVNKKAEYRPAIHIMSISVFRNGATIHQRGRLADELKAAGVLGLAGAAAAYFMGETARWLALRVEKKAS
ncbi:hypothetical protein [Achromobacter sp.]|uniref:hypothetical protein n=1 Tax=Achromobacter sp. TaxID=134375 RepID=UPI0028AADF30|nr:hypothetical protein [Achromobacter sp.]